jgi:hypothetical protein
MGHPISPETRAKISAALKGRQLSAQHKASISSSGKGRSWKRKNPVPEETRQRLSEAAKGIRNPRFNSNRAAVIAKLKAQRFMRDCLRRLLVNKHSSSASLLRYTKEELIAHIEAKFSDGMTWENYGEWHIDHITERCMQNLIFWPETQV